MIPLRETVDWGLQALSGALFRTSRDCSITGHYGRNDDEFVNQGIERKRTEESLQSSEERFRLLVEGVQNYAIFVLDPAGRLVTRNDRSERTKWYRADEILGQHLSQFYEKEAVELEVIFEVAG